MTMHPSPEPSLHQPPSMATPSPGVLFIVDDEPLVTTSLEAYLSLETEHELHVFNDPHEALAALDTYQPELILSDFVMPKLNGIQFLKQAKLKVPEATCILLTGYADKENAIASINDVGLYRYMQKPWDNNELLLNITNGLERARLVSNLKATIHNLEETQQALAHTNQHLEALVEERTQDLQQTYQQLHSIVSHATDGIMTVDKTGQITSYNPAVGFWLEQYDLGKSQPNSTAWLNLGFDELFQMSGSPLGEQLSQLTDEIRTEAWLGKRPLEINCAPILEGERGFVLMLRDITQRKETERLREDFVSTLTHDLRTPLLAAIQTFGFFLDGSLGELNEKQNQLLTMLHNSHRDLLGMVNTLLEVYKYEAGRQTLVLDRLDLNQLTKQVVDELHSLAEAKEQQLLFQAPSNLKVVQADRQELRRVIVNLVGNAIHHSPRGGQIEVSLQEEAERLCLQVRDNGNGIPAKDLPHLFQRFSQGTSRKRNSGTGLGLYLSRQIIEAHGGTIHVESTEGKGSRFYFYLPLVM